MSFAFLGSLLKNAKPMQGKSSNNFTRTNLSKTFSLIQIIFLLVNSASGVKSKGMKV